MSPSCPPRVPAPALASVTVSVVALALLAGCGPASGAASPGGGGGDPGGPWADYAPDVRSRIDRWTEQRSCAKLAGTRQAAEAGGPDTRRRTGHDNAALLAYLDLALQRAGCFTDGDPASGTRSVSGADHEPDGWRPGPATTSA